MATKQIGITAPVPVGEWNATTTYNQLNIVTLNSSTYIAKQASVGVQPGVTSGWADYWQVIFDVSVAVSALQGQFLPTSGGTMTGNIGFGTGLSINPPADSTVFNGIQVKGNVRLDNGLLYMNGKRIALVATPTANTDAANKQYVDTHSPASATVDGTGLISFKNSAGTTLFTLQLPISNGDVS